MAFSIIDRRLNSRGKSTVNRKRFVDRVKHQIRKKVKKSIEDGKITDIIKDKTEKISVPKGNIEEHTFRHDNGGVRQRVFPGNKEFLPGDRITRPPSGGGGGSKASKDGEGEDDFEFTITNDEYMDIFYEDLELPNLEKKDLATSDMFEWKRCGFVTDGDPSRLDLMRSMKEATGRRLSLSGGKNKKIKELKKEMVELKIHIELYAEGECLEEKTRIVEIENEILELKRRIKKIPFIDEIDLRFRNHVKVPIPITQATMICIMDVSGSMGQWHKEMAKRFYMLLYLFLTRKYEKIDVVFIRHHTKPKEVDEDEFFYSKETGGTLVSPALELANDIILERYPLSNWNIYISQATDGDNWPDDNIEAVSLLDKKILPMTQYYSYIEINDDKKSDLWDPYEQIKHKYENKFAMAKISDASDIFPVFRGLFQK